MQERRKAVLRLQLKMDSSGGVEFVSSAVLENHSLWEILGWSNE